MVELLRNSASACFPTGLANSSGLVGKNLMLQPWPMVFGYVDEEVDGDRGPQTVMWSKEFYETDPSRGFVRGYTLQFTRGTGPANEAITSMAAGRLPWGKDHHRVYRTLLYHRLLVGVACEDLPEEHNRVTLDPVLKDSHGIPAPKIDYTISENTRRMMEHGIARASEILATAGAKNISCSRTVLNYPGHLLGTARMGLDPERSVVNEWGRCHDVKNLFIVDGSNLGYLIARKRKWTMKAGVVYPQIELGGDTGAVKAFAQAAEDLGYDHIVIYDHVLGAVHEGREQKLTGPYKESDPFHEPLVTYAYLAGVTKKLELVTGVIILPQRQTALFAKQAADVDLFSDGRLRLGVGVGWNWVEFDGLEMSRHFRRRGKRQEQQIALIRKLWEQPVVDHEDSDHRIDRAGILPRPKRQIPIWLGGFSEAAYDRAARIGDGFLFSGRTQTEAVQIKARIVAKLRELGRDADTFGFESIQQYSRGDNQWPGDIAAWRKAGGSHISVVTMSANLDTVDAHIEAIKRWRDVYNSVR